MPGSEVSQEVLEEGCYHLSKLGLPKRDIASHFETSPGVVSRLVGSYASKLKSGLVVEGESDRAFWESVMKEAEGDMKLTVVSGRGFHHVWKSDLEKLDGDALMALYESTRDFVGADPNQKFLDYPPPKGYDPLAMDREVKRAMAVLGELLEARWKKTLKKEKRKRPTLK